MDKILQGLGIYILYLFNFRDNFFHFWKIFEVGCGHFVAHLVDKQTYNKYGILIVFSLACFN